MHLYLLVKIVDMYCNLVTVVIRDIVFLVTLMQFSKRLVLGRQVVVVLDTLL